MAKSEFISNRQEPKVSLGHKHGIRRTHPGDPDAHRNPFFQNRHDPGSKPRAGTTAPGRPGTHGPPHRTRGGAGGRRTAQRLKHEGVLRGNSPSQWRGDRDQRTPTQAGRAGSASHRARMESGQPCGGSAAKGAAAASASRVPESGARMIAAVLATISVGCLWGAWGSWRDHNAARDVGALAVVGCTLGVSALVAL